jgi:hypothetical protein
LTSGAAPKGGASFALAEWYSRTFAMMSIRATAVIDIKRNHDFMKQKT